MDMSAKWAGANAARCEIFNFRDNARGSFESGKFGITR